MPNYEVHARVTFADTVEAETADEASRIVGDRLRGMGHAGIYLNQIDVKQVIQTQPPIPRRP